ncbi:ammonium transporter, partial [Staphylococcus haemolyticus]
GLNLAIIIGNGKKNEKIQPQNLLINLIGGILLWIGRYGYKTGSAYTINDVALTSYVNTIIAASGVAFSWLVYDYCITNK